MSYVSQTGFKLVLFPPQLPKAQDYRHVLSILAQLRGLEKNPQDCEPRVRIFRRLAGTIWLGLSLECPHWGCGLGRFFQVFDQIFQLLIHKTRPMVPSFM